MGLMHRPKYIMKHEIFGQAENLSQMLTYINITSIDKIPFIIIPRLNFSQKLFNSPL